MTELPPTPRCAYCRRPIAIRAGPGRPSLYCRRSHRQRAYEARRRAAEASLPDGQVIVNAGDLDRLHDRLYAVEAALDDVESDLTGPRTPTLATVRRALDHLRTAAEDLRGIVIEPVTV